MQIVKHTQLAIRRNRAFDSSKKEDNQADLVKNRPLKIGVEKSEQLMDK